MGSISKAMKQGRHSPDLDMFTPSDQLSGCSDVTQKGKNLRELGHTKLVKKNRDGPSSIRGPG